MNRSHPPTVFLVDDDTAAIASLSWLLEADGLRVESYHSAGEVLDEFDPDAQGCFIADVRMPDINGLELQEELSRRGGRHPIIFVTGYGDVSTCSQAYRNGAFDFFEKPVNEQLLLDQVHRALTVDSNRRAQRAIRPDLATLVASLTPREMQVMDLLLEGKSVKQIAVELSVGFPTAARHRTRVLEKMQVHNDVELVRLVLAPIS
jgi:two-component system, LuxR family, response regulator FixJ